MQAAEATSFSDKRGNPIHYGDILQLGLGISDRRRLRVVHSTGKHAHLANPDDVELKYGSFKMTQEHASKATIVDHLH